MQLIKRNVFNKKRLLISTILSATALLFQTNFVWAEACVEGTNGDCTIEGEEPLALGQITANNINTPSTQTGSLDITGTGESSLSGNVYLSGLYLSGNGTVVFSGAESKISLVNLNDGRLVVNGDALYISDLNSQNATTYGTGTLHLDDGWIDSTGGNKLSGLVVGSGEVKLSYNGQGVNLGSVTYASSGEGSLTVYDNDSVVSIDSYTAQSNNNNLTVASGGVLNVGNITAYGINASGSQNGTINVSGTGTFNGNAYLENLTAGGTLNITGTVSAENVDLNRVSGTGTLTVTGADTSYLRDTVSIGTLSSTGTGMLDIAGTVSAENVDLKKVSGSGTLTVTGTEASYLRDTVDIGRLNSTGTGTLNVTGAVTAGNIESTGTGALNITGTVSAGKVDLKNVSGTGTLTVTGTGASYLRDTVNIGTLNSTGTGVLNITGMVAANTVDLKKVSGTGMLTVTGTGPSYLHNTVNIGTLKSTGTGTLNITGTVSAENVDLKKVSGSGTLTVTGTGPSYLRNTVNIGTLESTGTGTLNISGTVTANTVDLKNVSGTGTLRLDDGRIDSTGGDKLSNLVVGTGLVTLSAGGEDVNLGSVTYASSSSGGLKVNANGVVSIDSYTSQSNNRLLIESGGVLNVGDITAYGIINTAVSQTGTVNVSGTGTFVFASLENLTADGTLNITGMVTARNVDLKNVSGTGRLTVTGTGNSYLRNTVDIGTLSSTGTGTLNITGTVTAGNVNLNKVNDEDNRVGTLNVEGAGTSSFKDDVYLDTLSVSNGTLNISKGTTYLNSLSYDAAKNIQVVETGKLVVGNRATNLVNSVTYFPSGGISDGGMYYMLDGTQTGAAPNADVDGQTFNYVVHEDEGSVSGTIAYTNGYYSTTSAGINIEARSGTPLFSFDGGVIWDYSGFAPALNEGKTMTPGIVIGSNTITYSKDPITSHINISNGIFTGKIDIRKGSPVYEYVTSKDGAFTEHEVSSQGNINIYNGNFYVSDESKIKMYSSNSGSVNISGGNWFVGYDQDGNSKTNGNMSILAPNQNINITGGVFQIDTGRTLRLSGLTGVLAAQSSNYGFRGNGTLALDFGGNNGSFTISSDISWGTGRIEQQSGKLIIASNVMVKEFQQLSGTLEISSVLSIESDIRMSGNLTGGGELKLSETANAEFGKLQSFGTISLGRGSVTFATGESNFSVLNGAKGANSSEKIGLIRINSQTTIDTVNLNNSTLILDGELITREFNFNDGEVIFATEGAGYSLTLTASSTIWNTSRIHTSGSHEVKWENSAGVKNETYTAIPGTLTIKDGMQLTFADKQGYADAFVSDQLTVKVENSAQALFNSNSVTFDSLQMTKGTARVQSGTVNVGTILFGNLINAGTLTIDSGATLNATYGDLESDASGQKIYSLKATKGSTVNINGTLNVATLFTEGDEDAMGTLTGSGTLKITKEALFNGLMDMTGKSSHVIIEGTEENPATAKFDSQTGSDDKVGNMTVKNAVVDLENGTLEIYKLIMDHGTINLVNEDVVLALKENPGEMSGSGNSISGKGILRLMDNVDISFGGDGDNGTVGYLGGLQIGTGTATITGDTSLGSVEFTSASGGILEIESGKVLTLTNEPGNDKKFYCDRANNCSVQSKSQNVISGTEGSMGGTLNLVNGNGSIFDGQVLLERLNFGNYNGASASALTANETGTITFNYIDESKIDTFYFGYQDFDGTPVANTTTKVNVVVNNGTLTIANTFGDERVNVYGSGTLNLLGGGRIQNNYKSDNNYLANLIVGSDAGNALVIGGGSGFRNISFSSENGKINLAGDVTVLNTITVGQNNKVEGSSLVLSGTSAQGYFESSLSELTNLSVSDGATAYIKTDTSIGDGTGLLLNSGVEGKKSTVDIAEGKTLTVKSDIGKSSEEDPTTVVTGDGTLNLDGNISVYSSLTGLENLTIGDMGDVFVTHAADITNVTTDSGLTFEKNTTIGGDIQINGDGTLTLSGDSNTITGTTTIAGILNLTNGTESMVKTTNVSNVVFDGTGELNTGAHTVLNVLTDITVGASNILAGDGIINLVGNATGTFAMDNAFNGTIKIGTGTANIQTNKEIGKILFANVNGGVLNIEDGYTLQVSQIITDGTNQITGQGTLNLVGEAGNALVSEFKAPLGYLARMKISGGAAKLYNAVNIDKLQFDKGGYINLVNPESVLSIKELSQTNTGTGIGAIYGAGSVVATGNSGDVLQFSTGGNALASATIGQGTLDFIGSSNIGMLRYSSVDGTINIQDGVTVTVTSEFSGTGRLTGGSRAELYLQGNANAHFNYADGYAGSIKADEGTLQFSNTSTNFDKLTLGNATASFNQGATINSVTIDTGLAKFRESANINILNITGSGQALFSKSGAGIVSIGTFSAGQGLLTFEKDATLRSGGTVSGGTLNLNTNALTVESGKLILDDHSKMAISISRSAINEAGEVQETGYGRIIIKDGAELDVRSDVALELSLEYGVHTSTEGAVFQISKGKTNGEFVFHNNRYSFTKEDSCSSVASGLCYRLTQEFSAGEYAQEEAGTKNQVDTAAAFLDGELFQQGTKAFFVAEHLDALSQKGSSKSYLNALTALAPDITNAMSRQPVALQAKISNTLSGRLNGLLGNMGSSSRTYRDIQKMYGRSGGSPYRSRFMRSSDYYRRAGYYDQDDQPTTRKRPAYRRRIDPDSREAMETTTERKRWAKRNTRYTGAKDFGIWGQTYYNTAEYLSTDEPEGFSSDTTGFAIGADVQLFDVFALGLGYSSTSSTVDSLQRSTDVEGNSFFVYGMYKPSDWFISSILNMSSLSYKESKDISGMVIGDEYDGSSLGVSVMFGKDLKTWTPSVGFRYVSSDRDAHKDEIGQDIDSISTSVTTFVAEGRWNRDFAKRNDSYWHSELTAALTYDLSTSNESVTVNLQNGSFYTVEGEDFSNMGVELGASLAWLYGDHIDVSAGYNMEWKQDYLSHTLTATFRYSF